MSLTFHSWQAHPVDSMGKAPYNTFSPNLALVAAELRRRFGAKGGSGFNVRPVRGGELPSSHGFGAAWDATMLNSVRRAAAIAWLIEHSEALGVQAIHDYHGCRIWRVGRTSSKDPNAWWKPQTPSKASGMGQPTSVWLHIETTPDRWADTTPIATRLGSGAQAPSPPSGQRPVLRRTPSRLDDATADLVRIVQRAVGVTDDGWFGPATERAVRDYQTAHGLYVDGIVGKNTWASIDRKA